jgi:hypothetical protein
MVWTAKSGPHLDQIWTKSGPHLDQFFKYGCQNSQQDTSPTYEGIITKNRCEPKDVRDTIEQLHKFNNQQDEPCHPTPSGFALSLSMGKAAAPPSHGATKSWRLRYPTPYAGRKLSGLRSLLLVCLFGGVK